MEWAQEGDLYDLIKNGSKRRGMFRQNGEEIIRFILACTILGMEYLHQNGVIYSDLKPENVLIFSDGYVKLSDFGLSKQLVNEESVKCSNRSGTVFYFAPEVLTKG